MSSSRRITPGKSFLILGILYLIVYCLIRTVFTPGAYGIRVFGTTESIMDVTRKPISAKGRIQCYTGAALTTLYYPFIMIEETITGCAFVKPSDFIKVSNGGTYTPPP
ncbi:hypothetical protein SAMN02745181_3458 [Rubritalea squalenifaciens DSM 18772]|uniref:Uncharacterized protein n=1 Tax=Rubritalea squalenifaciens DSM 18772 TaxID=1123071 RepID=A0A1M6QNV4_9BACT|nr:hypothetical protein [Rubritalea squalenifaciens]SHK21924.1 hypothetical protein SAMN02745181_3458 [Rubritalea squalenifaciens DSM 18772]